MKKNEAFYILMVLAGSVLWGTTGTAQHFAPVGTSPLSIGAVRLAVGGTALTILALSKGAVKGKEIWLNPNTYISAVSVAAYQLFFFAAVLKTGVAMGTVVAIGSAPVFAGIFSMVMGREKPDSKWIVATLVSIIGCILLMLTSHDFPTQHKNAISDYSKWIVLNLLLTFKKCQHLSSGFRTSGYCIQ